MRGLSPQELAVVGAPSIVTAYLFRLDFQSETVCGWTGVGSIQPTGSGDSLLDGQTVDELVAGIADDIGPNSMKMSGSDELTVSIAVGSSPSVSIAAAQVIPAEYQGRQATIWRGLLYPQLDPLAQPLWIIRRIRTGSMDRLEVQDDGTYHRLTLTIESHQGLISNATNQTYLDQKRYDLADTSQDYAASIANGDPAPSKGVVSVGSGGGSVPYWKMTGDDYGVNRINY